ncbi:helix-turn-helix domain-containing protein [Sphingomonas sp. RHCKR47]|uniref:LexA family transcriptional regulator n=1 Tax=Sphingomonas citricola TaxID=2862498 RepID=UPI001CA52A92|nr:XRE family transcriptional regulator [Sphingomonas citricola]MBW6522419.1 helix-turn-helix domain-containing protein [Sphingomonas citricola]
MIKRDRLQEVMSERGMSQAALASLAGVSAAAVQQILNGKTRRTRYLPDIAKALGVTEEWLKGEAAAREGFVADDGKSWIVALRSLSLSDIAFDINEATGAERFFDRRLLPFDPNRPADQGDFFVLSDLGSDMAPSIAADDHVIVDETQVTIDRQGGVWALSLASIAMIRRVTRIAPQRLMLTADAGPHHTVEVNDADVFIFGRIVWHSEAKC